MYMEFTNILKKFTMMLSKKEDVEKAKKETSTKGKKEGFAIKASDKTVRNTFYITYVFFFNNCYNNFY
jgi:hypothetical protein